MGKRKREEFGLTLFSFLDLMTGTIGILLLVLVSVTIISVKTESKKVLLKIRSDKKEKGVKTPYFVICEENKVVMLPGFQEAGIENMEDVGSPFLEFTNKLDRLKEYIIFAVRPNGIDCFKKARRIVESREIDIGYEPVNQEWKIQADVKEQEVINGTP